ncbi:hypothetical protein G7Y89_g15274 [Cudoniella acicularis]|uniref:Uncharacterized protein n=1 Tax=Cudoniella acicularis TaxID=354080 RepID=A0A8H4QRM8_9HELO|nr:hypothetical protein G7Y89_g15274 [Cudoniella acicularis]
MILGRDMGFLHCKGAHASVTAILLHDAVSLFSEKSSHPQAYGGTTVKECDRTSKSLFKVWILLYPLMLVQVLKRRINKWRFLFDAPGMIQSEYDKAKGGNFVVQNPDVSHTFVSSKKFIREIDAAPDSVLSLQAAAKQVIQPQYSMHKFNWFDQRGVDGTPLVKTLRNLLTNNLPSILPETHLASSAIFDKLFNSVEKKPHVSKMVREAVAHTNALSIFGKDLAGNKDFMKGALDFTDKTMFIAEAVRLLPSFIAPKFGMFLANRFDAHKVIHATLVPVAEERLLEREKSKLGHN